MKCKNCEKFKRNKNIDMAKELFDYEGQWGINGTACKAEDNCKNGNFAECK
jgi:uncharacterized protein YdaT